MIDWIILEILLIPIALVLIYNIVIKGNKDFIIKRDIKKYPSQKVEGSIKTSLYNGFKSKPKYFRRNETHNR